MRELGGVKIYIGFWLGKASIVLMHIWFRLDFI
jgi:hypothetical protein